MPIKAIVSDFSRVLLLPADASYTGGLNALNVELTNQNKNYVFFDYFRLNTELL